MENNQNKWKVEKIDTWQLEEDLCAVCNIYGVLWYCAVWFSNWLTIDA